VPDQRSVAPGIGATERVFPFGTEKIFRRNLAVRKDELAADAVVEMPAVVALVHAQAGCIARDQEQARAAGPAVDFDREQPGQRRVGDAVLDAVDHPGIAGAYRSGLHVGVARFGSMIMDTEGRIAVGL
jgi:hypothetical protein